MVISRAILVTLALTTMGCRPAPRPIIADGWPEPALAPEQRRFLDQLEAAAQREPHDFYARKAAGLAYMWLTLAGHVSLRDTAEHHLEAAFRIDPGDAELARSLGRFYNMRVVHGDWSKADEQVLVYQALLGEADPDRLERGAFVAWTFSQMGRALAFYEDRRPLAALRAVDRLEDALEKAVRRHPDDLEMRALAGNFAFFLAGNLPLGKRARVRRGVAHFTILRERWAELRLGARDPHHCPNTRDNFMFELAEGHLVLGETEQARPIYHELAQAEPLQVEQAATLTIPHGTRARQMIAAIARERLANLDRYARDPALMPPWPSDVGNCIVCHSWNADIPTASLRARNRIDFTTSVSPPIKPMRRPGAVHAKGEEAHPALPTAIKEVLSSSCRPCHFRGGDMVILLDLSDAATVRDKAAWISHKVASGEMPPTGELAPQARRLIEAWIAGELDDEAADR